MKKSLQVEKCIYQSNKMSRLLYNKNSDNISTDTIHYNNY